MPNDIDTVQTALAGLCVRCDDLGNLLSQRTDDVTLHLFVGLGHATGGKEGVGVGIALVGDGCAALLHPLLEVLNRLGCIQQTAHDGILLQYLGGCVGLVVNLCHVFSH